MVVSEAGGTSGRAGGKSCGPIQRTESAGPSGHDRAEKSSSGSSDGLDRRWRRPHGDGTGERAAAAAQALVLWGDLRFFPGGRNGRIIAPPAATVNAPRGQRE